MNEGIVAQPRETCIMVDLSSGEVENCQTDVTAPRVFAGPTAPIDEMHTTIATCSFDRRQRGFPIGFAMVPAVFLASAWAAAWETTAVLRLHRAGGGPWRVECEASVRLEIGRAHV